jgi:hypothetical protein
MKMECASESDILVDWSLKVCKTINSNNIAVENSALRERRRPYTLLLTQRKAVTKN